MDLVLADLFCIPMTFGRIGTCAPVICTASMYSNSLVTGMHIVKYILSRHTIEETVVDTP